MHQRTWLAIPVGVGFSRVESESHIHSVSLLLAGRVEASKSHNTHISPEGANLPEQISIVAPTGWDVDGQTEDNGKLCMMSQTTPNIPRETCKGTLGHFGDLFSMLLAIGGVTPSRPNARSYDSFRNIWPTDR